MTPLTMPLSSLHEEAHRILEAADSRGVRVRAIGGLAVWMLCPSAREEPLLRQAKDIDLVGLCDERQQIDQLLAECGYIETVSSTCTTGAR